MTTLTNLQPYYEVLARVDQVRARIRSLQLAEGGFGFLAFACGSIFLATLAQGFLRFGSYGRLTLLVLGAATILATFWRYVIEPLRHEPNDKEVARYIETRLPQLGNNLINAILLAEDADSWSPALLERAVGEAALGARSVDLMEAVSTRLLHRRILAGLAAAALLTGFIVVSPGRFSSALHQILAPFDRNIAAIGSVEFQNITPQDAAWVKGEPLEIVATIKDPRGRAYDGFVEITEGSTGRVSRQALVRGSEGLDHFSFRVPQVLQPTRSRSRSRPSSRRSTSSIPIPITRAWSRKAFPTTAATSGVSRGRASTWPSTCRPPLRAGRFSSAAARRSTAFPARATRRFPRGFPCSRTTPIASGSTKRGRTAPP